MRLKEKLQGAVPEVLLTRLSGRMHIIGDIAILSIPPELDRYGVQIGQAALSTAGGIKSVFKKTSGLHGERRVASLEHLAGRAGTVTVHREYGHIYRLDVAEVFFNSRLGYERMRVASAVQAGEEVLLAFVGVGPFAVPLAARGGERPGPGEEPQSLPLSGRERPSQPRRAQDCHCERRCPAIGLPVEEAV